MRAEIKRAVELLQSELTLGPRGQIHKSVGEIGEIQPSSMKSNCEGHKKDTGLGSCFLPVFPGGRLFLHFAVLKAGRELGPESLGDTQR